MSILEENSSGDEGKENKPEEMAKNMLGNGLNNASEMRKRIRRRSTGSTKLEGLA